MNESKRPPGKVPTDRPKLFPIHRNSQGLGAERLKVPWTMMEEHERQADINHGQTIKRLAERGGCSLLEILAILADMKPNQVVHAFGLSLGRSEGIGSSDIIGEIQKRVDLWNSEQLRKSRREVHENGYSDNDLV